MNNKSMIISLAFMGLIFIGICYVDSSSKNNTAPITLTSHEANQKKIIGYGDDSSPILSEEPSRDAEIEYVAPE
jgi:hypothetical protein